MLARLKDDKGRRPLMVMSVRLCVSSVSKDEVDIPDKQDARPTITAKTMSCLWKRN